MIRVEIVNAFLVNTGNEYVILLRGTGNEVKTLPISIGQLEAQSIALQLNQIPFPRPLTHDLMKDIIIKLEGKIIRTEIYDLRDETFFARLILEVEDKTFQVESRPSDAIAIAIRFNAPVFVSENVMEEAGVFLPSSPETIQHEESIVAQPGDVLQAGDLNKVDLLHNQLETAISQERYEDAARLRDEIIKLTKSN